MVLRNVLLLIFVLSQGNVEGSKNVRCSKETFALQAYMNETTKPGTIVESYIFDCTLNELNHLDSKDAFAYFEFKIAEKLPDKTTITLTLRKQFDYLDKETTMRNYWSADFTVKHKFGKQDGILLLTVTDENTQPPTFEKSTYNYNIPESFPLNLDFTTIDGGDQIAAHDDDYPVGNNNKLTFTIIENSQLSQIFSIDSRMTKQGHYLLELKLQKKLDCDISLSHYLILTAKDTSYETTAIVTVNVTCERPPLPMFQQKKYNEKLIASQLQERKIKLHTPIKATACFPHNGKCFPIKYEIDYEASDDAAQNFEIEDKAAEQISSLIIRKEFVIDTRTVIVIVIKASLEMNEDYSKEVFLKLDIESENENKNKVKGSFSGTFSYELN